MASCCWQHFSQQNQNLIQKTNLFRRRFQGFIIGSRMHDSRFGVPSINLLNNNNWLDVSFNKSIEGALHSFKFSDRQSQTSDYEKARPFMSAT